MKNDIRSLLLLIALFLSPLMANAQNIDIGAPNASAVYPVWSCAADGLTYTIFDNVTVTGTGNITTDGITFNIVAAGVTVTWQASITGSLGFTGSLVTITGAASTININIDGSAVAWGTDSKAITTNGDIIVNGGTVTSEGTRGIAINTTGSGSMVTVRSTSVVEAAGAYGIAIKTEGDNSKITVIEGGTVSVTCNGKAILCEGADSELAVTSGGIVNSICNGIAIQTNNANSKITIDGGTVKANSYAIYNLGANSEIEVSGDGTVMSTGDITIRTEGANSNVSVTSGTVGDIYATGDYKVVTVTGGSVNSVTTAGDYAEITVVDGSVGEITTAGDDSKVIITNGAIGGISTNGANNTVSVSGGIVSGSKAISATGANNTVTVSGGTVSGNTAISATGTGNTVNVSGTAKVTTTSGIAILSSGQVQIYGGTVSASNEMNVYVLPGDADIGFYVENKSGIAIQAYGSGSTVVVSGGIVSATTGAAIESDGAVTVSGGLVFAYGDDVKGDDNVIDANSFTGATATGVVIGWDKDQGNVVYCIYSDTDLSKDPAAATVMWDIENNAGGIRYTNGTNSGFVTINGITVTRRPTAADFIYQLTDTEYDCTDKSITVVPVSGMATVTVNYNGNPEPPTNAGTYQITVDVSDIAAGSNFCPENGISLGNLIIRPTTLTVTALDIVIQYGTDPATIDLTGLYEISGFVCGDDEDVLTQKPTVRISADINGSTMSGVYPGKVVVSGGLADNYAFAYIPGTLTVIGTGIMSVTANGHETVRDGNNFIFDDPDCGNDRVTVYVVTEDPQSIVTINGIEGNTCDVNLNLGVNMIDITVTFRDGSVQSDHTLTIERQTPFDQIVKMRWEYNTLTVINNGANNGGFDFSSARYQWFCDDQPISNGTEQSLSSDPNGGILSQGYYHVEVSFSASPGFIRTCSKYVSFNKMEVSAWPNPVRSGQTLYLEADVEDEMLKNGLIEVYNISGIRVDRLNVQGRLTPVCIRYAQGIHIFILKGKDGFKKELKVIVE